MVRQSSLGICLESGKVPPAESDLAGGGFGSGGRWSNYVREWGGCARERYGPARNRVRERGGFRGSITGRPVTVGAKGGVYAGELQADP